MGECNEEAHCWVNTPAGCLPSSDYWPLMGSYSIPRTSKWSSFEADQAQAGYHGGEGAPTKEGLNDKLLRFLHPVRSPYSPEEFVDKTENFLKSIGAVHVASVEVDGTSAYSLEGNNDQSLSEFGEQVKSYLAALNHPAKMIEIRVLGRSKDFFMDMSIVYRPVHSSHDPGLSFSVGARPVALDVQEGETAADHALRLDRLALDTAKVEQLQQESERNAKALTDDLSHHISEAFPGTKFVVGEHDETRLALGLGES